MGRPAVTIAALAITTTLVGACGSDDGPNDQQAAVIEAAAPVAATVRWDGNAFDPSTVTVPAGQALELVNDGDAPARWTGGDYDTGEQQPGEVIRLVFDEPGTITFALATAEPVVLTVEITAP